MTLLAESRLSFVAGAPSRALRYLAPTAFATDVLAVTLAGAAAALGRDRLGDLRPLDRHRLRHPRRGRAADDGPLAAGAVAGRRLLPRRVRRRAPTSTSASSTPACSPRGSSARAPTWPSSSCPAASSCCCSRSGSRRWSPAGSCSAGPCTPPAAAAPSSSASLIAGTPSHVDEVARVLRRETLARLRRRRRARPAPGRPVRDRVPAYRWSAPPTSCSPRSAPPTRTSSSSRAAPSTPPASCAASPGSSRTRTSRSWSPPASPTSPRNGSGSAPWAACR